VVTAGGVDAGQKDAESMHLKKISGASG